jgi:hypothetical protein
MGFQLLSLLASTQGLAKLAVAGVLCPPSRLYRDRWSLLDDAVSIAESTAPELDFRMTRAIPRRETV